MGAFSSNTSRGLNVFTRELNLHYWMGREEGTSTCKRKFQRKQLDARSLGYVSLCNKTRVQKPLKEEVCGYSI